MSFVVGLVSLLFGLIVSTYLYAWLLLPLIYNLPMSIYYYYKGVLRFAAIPMQLIAPVFWTLILFALGFILAWLAPRALAYLLTDPYFVIGQLIGLLMILKTPLTKAGRADLWHDYERRTFARLQKNE